MANSPDRVELYRNTLSLITIRKSHKAQISIYCDTLLKIKEQTILALNWMAIV